MIRIGPAWHGRWEEAAAADPAGRKLALQLRHDKSDAANFNSISFGPVSKLVTRCVALLHNRNLRMKQHSADGPFECTTRVRLPLLKPFRVALLPERLVRAGTAWPRRF